MQTIIPIILIILSVVSFLILDSFILSRLREHDNTVFKAIGEPNLFVHMATKYRYWFSFLLLGKFHNYQLSKTTQILCRLNRASLFVLFSLLFIWMFLAK